MVVRTLTWAGAHVRSPVSGASPRVAVKRPASGRWKEAAAQVLLSGQGNMEYLQSLPSCSFKGRQAYSYGCADAMT